MKFLKGNYTHSLTPGKDSKAVEATVMQQLYGKYQTFSLVQTGKKVHTNDLNAYFKKKQKQYNHKN